MVLQSLFSGMFMPHEYCGKVIYLSQDDIENGRNRIRIASAEGVIIKGDAGLVGRKLIENLGR